MRGEGFSYERTSGEEESLKVPVEKRIYETEGGPVELEWKEIFPTKKEGIVESEQLASVNILLPGWGFDAKSKSFDSLSGSFADYSSEPTYLVSARAVNSSSPDMLRTEADAIRQLINEKKLPDIVVCGVSEGGDRGIDLVNMIEDDDSETRAKGLILIDSTGLYEQESRDVTTNFARELIEAPRKEFSQMGRGRSSIKPAVRAYTDMIFSTLKEMGKARIGYFERLSREVDNMAKLNRRAGIIKAPVILVNGAEDSVSDPKKIAPVGKPSEREAYLREHLFKASPYVRMVVAEKSGHHALALMRPESVARSSMYLLERFYRENKTRN